MEAQVKQIASTYLEGVRPTGHDGLRAKCPICGSKRAFVISMTHGGWICWSCGETGALVTLLQHFGMTRKQIDRTIGDLRLPPPLSDRLKRRKSLQEGWSLLPGRFST